MASIEDLDMFSISDASTDESIEMLRQLRLRRRTPQKAAKKTSKAKTVKKPKELTPEQAATILKLLSTKGE